MPEALSTVKRPLSNTLLLGLLGVLLLIAVWLLIETISNRDTRSKIAFESGRSISIDIASGEVRGHAVKGKTRSSREDRLKRQLEKIGATNIPKASLVERPDAGRVQEALKAEQALLTKRSALKVNERPIISPLSDAPIVALQETLSGGVTLPRVSDDSELEPWRSYSKPYSLPEGRAMLSLVITDLGMDTALTQQSLALNEYVTLSFSPYADALHDQMDIARMSGFETWLMLPMQHETYPVHDYGPLTLLNEETIAANMTMLHTVMSQGSGYAGMMSSVDEKFTRSKESEKIIGEIVRRGVAFTTYNNSLSSEYASPLIIQAERHIAAKDLPVSLDAFYRDLEQYITANGNAVITIAPLPAVIESLNGWIDSLPAKNIQLVPLTAHVKQSSK
jgi:polysaccharide deacetylase 2 family uncharacterized protein YibQ